MAPDGSDQQIPTEALFLLHVLVPKVTFLVLTTVNNLKTSEAYLSGTFYGARVRDRTLLSGTTGVNQLVALFLEGGHCQAVTMQGDLQVYQDIEVCSSVVGHSSDLIALDCTFLETGTYSEGKWCNHVSALQPACQS